MISFLDLELFFFFLMILLPSTSTLFPYTTLFRSLEARTFTGHRNSVTSVAFSPDGELLAAGCLGQVVIVWKRETGAIVKRLRYDDISYNSVAFSPRGEWLALGSRDLQLWLKAILTEE